jgi:nucleotide-binding universal stress UspA family protein
MLPIRTILHPTDFSDRSRNALQLATALARDYRAKLVLLHVVPRPIVAFGDGVIPPEPEDFREEARAKLDGLAAPGPGVAVERHVTEGDPAAVIVHSARELSADLIVLGTHGRTGLGRLLMGSVAEQVVRKAACPVLTVSAPFPPAAPPGTPVAEEMSVAGPL